MPTVFDRAGFKQVVDKSGLNKTELATVYGTTRQTIYNWLAGGEPNNEVLIRTFNRVTTGILKAFAKKLLPFGVGLSREERSKRVATMVATLHAQK